MCMGTWSKKSWPDFLNEGSGNQTYGGVLQASRFWIFFISTSFRRGSTHLAYMTAGRGLNKNQGFMYLRLHTQLTFTLIERLVPVAFSAIGTQVRLSSLAQFAPN